MNARRRRSIGPSLRLLLATCTLPLAVESQSTLLVSADSVLRGRYTGVLSRLISVEISDATIESALRSVATAGGVRLSYSADVLPSGSRVTITRSALTLGQAFRDVLRHTDLDVVVAPAGYVIVVRNPRGAAAPVVAGDSAAMELFTPLVRAAVRAQVMDRIIVMGTPASGASERSLSSAVTVFTGSQLQQQGLRTMGQIFRTAIPGIVAWDLGISGPFAALGSVRGSSSFSSNALKTYVDGVELASPYLLFALDPFSIERIEVIRGPQGSALYGSDAISGVVQVVTRRGSPAARWKPQLDAAMSFGRAESRFASGATTQRHSAMGFTGGGTTSLGFGGTWERSGGIVSGGSSGYAGTFGGGRTMLGPLRLDATVRYAEVKFTAPANPLFNSPLLAQAANDIRPLLEDQRIEHETYGITADYQTLGWWRQNLVIGLDRHGGAIPPQREPVTVADALLGATRERVMKASIRYATTFRATPGEATELTTTLGWERSGLHRERLGVRSEVVGVGAGLASLYRDDVDNTGVFGQLKVALGNSFFVTGGLRRESNSNFGQDYGNAWAPMIGAALTRDAGPAAVKVRAAFGRGIRPPQPSMRRAISTVGFRQLANPGLEPEIQEGLEAGIEVWLGHRLNLAVTAYNQNAEGLIQQVVANPRVSARTIQYQNVGRIHNTGLELEGSARAGRVGADLSFALTDSRVKALSPTYSGDLVVGDRVPEVPSSAGMASISVDVGRARTTFGTSFVGPWIGYNWLEYYGATPETSESRPLLRNYWVRYRSLTKPFAGISWTVGSAAEGYVRVDNLANVQRNERDDLQITAGRTATVGFRITR
ncbi:MAG: TonB-dependent receptor [Gemmatimonadota bacterium]